MQLMKQTDLVPEKLTYKTFLIMDAQFKVNERANPVNMAMNG